MSSSDSPLHIAVRNNDIDIAKIILQNRGDVHAVNAEGLTLLQLATLAGNTEMITLLLQHGAGRQANPDPPLQSPPCTGNTPAPPPAGPSIVPRKSINPLWVVGGCAGVILLLVFLILPVISLAGGGPKAQESQKDDPIDLADVHPFDPDQLVSDYKKSKETQGKTQTAKKAIQAAISSYEREITQLRNELQKKENLKKSSPPRQPVQRSDWSKLKMGEFEEEADFQKRVELAKQKSEADYSKAVDTWKANVKSHDEQWESHLKSLPELRKSTEAKIQTIEKKIADERKKADSTQTVNLKTKIKMVFPYSCDKLPTFDRKTMSFPSVKLVPLDMDWSVKPANEYCRFSIVGDASRTQSLYFPTLAKAKAFKEAYERGEVGFLVVAEVQYVESKFDKVITQEAQYKTITEDKVKAGKVFGNAARIALSLAVEYNGGEGSRLLEDGLTPIRETETRQELVRPEKSYSGTFHHYEVKMIGPVRAVDEKGFIDIRSSK